MEWVLAILALALLGVAAVSRRLSGRRSRRRWCSSPSACWSAPRCSTGSICRARARRCRRWRRRRSRSCFSATPRAWICDSFALDVGLPLRLLGVGLPLTIALGAVAAAAIFGALTIEEAVILGVVLAPTDAALGQAVVTEPRVPMRVREGLNVESGLNDGICVPLLFAAVALADVKSEISGGRSPATLLFEEIGYGVVGGVIGGLAVAAIVIYAGRRDLIDGAWRQVIPAAGAALAYGTANALGGSGFIAAFVAGMTFRLALGRDPGAINDLSEQVGNVLNGVTFVFFGAILLGPALGEVSWSLVLYAVLSLTVVRMLPVAVAMLGTPRQGADARLHRLVRAARAGLDRVRRDRDRGIEPSPRAPDRPRDLPDRRALGLRPRPDRGSPRRPLRRLVRAAPARQGAADGERRGPGDPCARTRAAAQPRALAVKRDLMPTGRCRATGPA